MISKEAVLELICEAKSVNIDERRMCFLRKIIEKDLEVLEIIKEQGFLFVEKGQLYVGRYADTELLLEEDDFQDKQEYELLKEVFGNE